MIKLEKDSKPNYQGIEDLTDSLKNNETVLSLNLNNTGLDHVASKLLREAMEINSTIILYLCINEGWILKTTLKWIWMTYLPFRRD